MSVTALTVASGITLTNAGTLTTPGIMTVNGTFSNGGTVTSTGTGVQLAGSGSFVNGPSAALNYAGSSVGVTAFSAVAAGNTVTYTSTTTAQTVRAGAYGNLTVDKSGRTATLGGPVTVSGALAIAAGTLDVGSGSNYALSVAGSWSNAGTFTARSGTVTFDGAGAQAVTGATTWYGLAITASSARSVTFQGGVTQTIAPGGSLTLAGAAGQRLTIASAAASPWRIDISSGVTQSVSHAVIRDSDASAGAEGDATGSTNVDGGGNTNWAFYGSTPEGSSPEVRRSAGFANTHDQYVRYAPLCFNAASCTLVQTIAADADQGISQLQVLIGAVGAPTGPLRFDLCEAGADGDGCASVLRSWSVGSGVVTARGWHALRVAPSLAVVQGRSYVLRVIKDADPDYGNHYVIGINYRRYGQTDAASHLYYWYRERRYGGTRPINALFLGS
jgi:hypothetical protein